MMNREIKVSVIIPVYQVENYLERAVDSVLAQTLLEKEIILVDDAQRGGAGGGGRIHRFCGFRRYGGASNVRAPL